MISRYGADSLRLYALFMGPPEDDAEWTDGGIAGCYRFLQRLWTLAGGLADGRRARDAVTGLCRRVSVEAGLALARKAHWAIDKSTRDSAERFHFNTAVAAAMELLNEVAAQRDEAEPEVVGFAASTLISLIQPYAPHIAEELWQQLGGERLWREPWPARRRGLPGARHRRDRGAGQRQAARPLQRARREQRRGADGARAGARERREPPRRPRGRRA